MCDKIKVARLSLFVHYVAHLRVNAGIAIRSCHWLLCCGAVRSREACGLIVTEKEIRSFPALLPCLA